MGNFVILSGKSKKIYIQKCPTNHEPIIKLIGIFIRSI